MLISCSSRVSRCLDYCMNFSKLFFLALIAVQSGSRCMSQDPQNFGTFELSAQGLSDPSLATVTPNELAVRDPAGTVTRGGAAENEGDRPLPR